MKKQPIGTIYYMSRKKFLLQLVLGCCITFLSFMIFFLYMMNTGYTITMLKEINLTAYYCFFILTFGSLFYLGHVFVRRLSSVGLIYENTFMLLILIFVIGGLWVRPLSYFLIILNGLLLTLCLLPDKKFVAEHTNNFRYTDSIWEEKFGEKARKGKKG